MKYWINFFLFFLLSSTTTLAVGEDGATFGTVVFLLVVSLGLILASWSQKIWSQDQLLHYTIKRGLLLLGMFSMWATSSVMVVLSNNASNLGLANIMATYMDIFGYVIMGGIILVFWSTFKLLLELFQERKLTRRMGDDDDD